MCISLNSVLPHGRCVGDGQFTFSAGDGEGLYSAKRGDANGADTSLTGFVGQPGVLNGKGSAKALSCPISTVCVWNSRIDVKMIHDLAWGNIVIIVSTIKRQRVVTWANIRRGHDIPPPRMYVR